MKERFGPGVCEDEEPKSENRRKRRNDDKNEENFQMSMRQKTKVMKGRFGPGMGEDGVGWTKRLNAA